MNFASARKKMIDEQLIARGIKDPRVIDAMMKVPRHEFVPPEIEDKAYDDEPLPIGFEQTISQPYMVALMTESLKLTGDEKVLEIGTGSGYQAAVLAELCQHVYSIERLADLSNHAQKILNRLHYNNITLRIGDGTEGWPEHAPFDAIIVTAGTPSIPKSYLEQLAPGGRLVIPRGNAELQQLIRVTRTDNHFQEEILTGCRFVKLIGSQGWNSE